MNTYKPFIVLLSLFISLSCFSQTSPPSKLDVDLSGNFGTRYDYQRGGDIHRIQDSIVLGFTVDAWGNLELVGLLQNTPRYGLKYHTAYDIKNDNLTLSDEGLYFKQIYLKKTFNNTSLALGALPALDKIGGHTTFGNNSWVDGGRVTFKYNKGMIGVTTGSINDLDNPHIISRERKLNYIEVYLSNTILSGVLAEASMGHLDGDEFLRVATQKDIEFLGDKILTLTAEGLLNRQGKDLQGSAAVDASTNVVKLINSNNRGTLNVSLKYSYGDPEIGLRGQVNDDRYMTGHNVAVGLSGYLNKEKSLKWNTSIDIREDPRFQAGINYTIPKKKNKKKNNQ